MKTEKSNENIHPQPDQMVRIKKMGNVSEIRFMISTSEMPIKKLNADTYLDLRTGEVLACKHIGNRAENLSSVAQSLRNLRDILNSNISDTKSCLWVTLTYKENMADPKRLYNDFRKFNQRIQYYLGKNKLPNCEYIVAAEPQARGAWHAHVVLIFPCKAPFIPNDVLASIWKHGFTKIKKLEDVDNVGLYLTAYLADMELTEAMYSGPVKANAIKEVQMVGSDGKGRSKAIVKGSRLKKYPPGFRLFRVSRGIKRPQIIECTEAEAMEIIGSTPLTYEKTLKVYDDNGTYRNTINYRQYNKVRKEKSLESDNRNE